MKNELYRSVSWLGSTTRTHLTHSATRYIILGIAAIFAAFLMVQAAGPASPVGAQDTPNEPTMCELPSNGTDADTAPIPECPITATTATYTVSVFDNIDPGEKVATLTVADGATGVVLSGMLEGATDKFELSAADEEDEDADRTLNLKDGAMLEGTKNYEVTLKVVDAADEENDVTATITIKVTQNLTTDREQTTIALSAGGAPRNLNLTPLFKQMDEDKEDITYTVKFSRRNVVRESPNPINGSNLRLAGVGEGLTDVTVTADPARGASETQTFQVRVFASAVSPTPTPVPTATVAPTPTARPATPTPRPATPTPRPVPTNTPTPTPEPTATPVPTNTPAPTNTPVVVEPTATPEPEDEGGIGIVGVIIGLIILVALGLLIFFLLRRRGQSDESPEGGPTMADLGGGDDDGDGDGGMDDGGDDDGGDEEDAADDDGDDDGDGGDEEENRQ